MCDTEAMTMPLTDTLTRLCHEHALTAPATHLSAKARVRLAQRLESMLGVDRVDLVVLPEAEGQLYYLRRAADLAPYLREQWREKVGTELVSPSKVRVAMVLQKSALVDAMLAGIATLPLGSPAAFSLDPRDVAAAESYVRRALEALLAAGHVVMRGISQTPEMVRWCARTSAYRVVGAPERRLAKTPLDRHLGRRGEGGRAAARPRRPRRRRPRATRAGETALTAEYARCRVKTPIACVGTPVVG